MDLDSSRLNKEFNLVAEKDGITYILDVGEFPYILQEAILWVFEDDGYVETYIIPEGSNLEEVIPLTINANWFAH